MIARKWAKGFAMPAVSFSDAAAHLGHSSRSTLYRLRDENKLTAYLRPGGRGGSQLLELSPTDLPSLRQHVERTVRPQINAAGARKIDHSSRGRVDRRWGEVAGLLSDALADVGGLSLTGPEAAAIADALPAAVCEVFGAAGAAQLREALAEAVGALPAFAGEPIAAPGAAGSDPLSFYRDYGRVEPYAEPLRGEPYWLEVAAWVNALLGRGPAAEPRADGSAPPEPYSWQKIAEISNQAADAGAAVDAGARFDLATWDATGARDHLIPDTAAGCSLTAEHLRLMLQAGRIPAELRSEALAALATHAPEPVAAFMPI